MDREKFEKAKEIDDKIRQCDDILERLVSCDSIAFREGDKVSGSAFRNTSTTGELFEAIVDVAIQYVVGRKEQLEKEFNEL